MQTTIPYTRFQDYRWKEIKNNLLIQSIKAAEQVNLFQLNIAHAVTEDEAKGLYNSTLLLLNEKKRATENQDFLNILELAEEFWLGLGSVALHCILIKGLASLLKPTTEKPATGKGVNEQSARKLYSYVMDKQLSEYRYQLDALYYSECTAKDMSKNYIQSLALIQQYYHQILDIRAKLLMPLQNFTEFALDGGLLPKNYRWRNSDVLQSAVSQSDAINDRLQVLMQSIGLRMQVTPLQMAVVAASIAQGQRVKPRLLLQLNGKTAKPATFTPLGINTDRIKQGMKWVPENGSSKKPSPPRPQPWR